ncbi:MAG: hypothetical protein RLZZ516_1514 [Cyanobacteriota bacterium]|jgi:septum site-determining protein MinC
MAHSSLPHRFRLRPLAEAVASPLEEVQHQLAGGPPSGLAVLDSADRPLTLPELQAIQRQLAAAGLELQALEAEEPLSLVPAAVLGLSTSLHDTTESEGPQFGDTTAATWDGTAQAAVEAPAELSIHRGTLRAGDHVQVEGSLLVLGDVNPGARVSAGGDVRIWGRLRGVAHAGYRGDRTARIVALQLRPVQLRIAAAVARGPEDLPPAGFCEEAVLVGGTIAIRPAEPSWPQGLG